MRIKALACDLDGTLLINGDKTVSEEDLGLIEKLIDEGVFFVAASGRQYANLQKLFYPFKERMGYICENGCLSIIGDKIIDKEVMDPDIAHKIIDRGRLKEGCEILVSGVNTCYIEPKNMSFYDHMVNFVGNDTTIVDNLKELPEEYFKVSLFEKDGIFDIDYWKEEFGQCCNVVIGTDCWIDITPKGVNKGSALERLLIHMGISSEDVMAIGDNENDIEMLKMVGWPVIMNSSNPVIFGLERIRTQTVTDMLRKLVEE
ncbi:MAG: HAD family hydrolase [Erysipelotrichaceae bacterium]|nr:HAD family hydrolase [Erysipelotrichaceae bacterium]